MSTLSQAQRDKLLALSKEYATGKISSVDFYKRKADMLREDAVLQKQKYDLKLAQAHAQHMKKAICSHKKNQGKTMPSAAKKRSM